MAAGVFVLTLAVYAITLGPTTDFWDCGEYITTSHIVGVPHQPGTPLYVLVGRVFDIVLGNPDITQVALRTAWAINFMSAFFSALAVMMVYLIVWELGRRMHPDARLFAHMGGVVGALFLAFSDTFWNNAIEAEVYGLSAFMLAALTWLGIRWYDNRDEAGSNNLLLLIVYLLGLGVGFHLHTMLAHYGVFLLVFLVVLMRQASLKWPDVVLMVFGLHVFLLSTMSRDNTLVLTMLGLYLLLVILRAAQGERFALWGSGLFFLGLTVHIMMLIRAGADPEPFINQTAPDNFETLMSVIRREQYPTLGTLERKASLGFQFQYYYDYLIKQFYWFGDGTSVLSRATTFLVPLLLAAVGLIQGFRRLWLLMLLPVVTYLFNGELLTIVLNFSANEVRDRDYFYFGAFLFMSIFIGMGATAWLRFFQGKEGPSADALEGAGKAWAHGVDQVKASTLVLVAGAVLVGFTLYPVTPGHTKFHEHDRSENRIAHEYAWNILAGLDENAIIFTNGDNDTFPIWYLQAVEHFRRDVTVVNLSLINLPWYIKQLQNGDTPVDVGLTDREIDEVNERALGYQQLFMDMRDGKVGLRLPRTDAQIEAMNPQEREQFLMSCIWELKNGDQDKVLRKTRPTPQLSRYVQTVLFESMLVKDYIVPQIVAHNKATADRPVFFAVTIPQENMERWFSRLQMEGMAYRLLETPSEDGMPRTDPQKVMENMLGVYRMGALTTGDTPQRRGNYAEMAGLLGDQGQLLLGLEGRGLNVNQLAQLAAAYGDKRQDVYRNTNARHLLGNYPAALNRAGYVYYQLGNQTAASDTSRYREYLNKAMVAFDACLRLEPENPQALEFTALLLVQSYRDEEAKAFLTDLQGRVPQAVEEQVVTTAMRGMLGGGVGELALEWAEERVQAQPDRLFYRQVLFTIYTSLGQLGEARRVMNDWTAHSGEEDPSMRQSLQDLQNQYRDMEQKQVESKVGEALGQ